MKVLDRVAQLCRYLRRPFCRHRKSLTWVRNLNVEEVKRLAGARSIWRCDRCGQRVYRRERQVYRPKGRGILITVTESDADLEQPPGDAGGAAERGPR